eukprot:8633229-Pyramimonas_sp.AAC.1
MRPAEPPLRTQWIKRDPHARVETTGRATSPPLSRQAIMESSAAAAADAITRLYAVPASSPGSQFRFHTPMGSVPSG